MSKRKRAAVVQFRIDSLMSWADNHNTLLDELAEMQNEEWLLKAEARELYKKADAAWRKFSELKKKRETKEEEVKKHLDERPPSINE